MFGVAAVHPSEFRQYEDPAGDRQDDHREHRPGADPGDRRGRLLVAVRHGGRPDQRVRVQLGTCVAASGFVHVHGHQFLLYLG